MNKTIKSTAETKHAAVSLVHSTSYALLHINLIQANRNIFTSPLITAESQFNVVTGGSGYSVLWNHGRPGALQHPSSIAPHCSPSHR